MSISRQSGGWDINLISIKSKTKRKFSKQNITHNALRLRMAFAMIMIVVAIILICWFVNKLFLPSYYQKMKISTLVDSYQLVNSDFSEDVIEKYDNREFSSLDSLYNEVESACDTKSIDVFVFKAYSLGTSTSYVQFYYPFGITDRQTDSIQDKFAAYSDSTSDQGNFDLMLLESNDNYKICKLYNHKLKSSSIELIGMLDSGLSIIISSNFESMQESAIISNTFLSYIGIIVALVASVIVFFVSKTITKPILDLSIIAGKMANLDFDARYTVRANDEIDVLGKSMNRLSDKLKQTISELKTANSELMKDIENKNKTEELRKEFLSNVSHELKTPIALIQGYAEGLNENINDDLESRQFYCDVIVDEARKMNNIVMKILDLNNIESGNSPVSIDRFDIVALINALITSTDILFQQKEATMIFDEKEPVFVWADEFMIEEVLTNYISNALNHVEGEKKIEIKLTPQENVLRVSVFNTGKCIPQEDIDKIWGKFYKVDKARTREYGGSGVGLSIVKAIMDSHGKKCGVINKENGVEFWFEADITN